MLQNNKLLTFWSISSMILVEYFLLKHIPDNITIFEIVTLLIYCAFNGFFITRNFLTLIEPENPSDKQNAE